MTKFTKIKELVIRFPFLWPLVYAVLLFAFVGAVWGFHYEEGTDSVMTVTMAALFKAETTNIVNNYGFHFLTSHIFKVLYRFSPAFPWYDWFILGLTFCATVNLYYLLRRGLKRWNPKGNLFISIPLYLLLSLWWAEHIALIQITRIAFLLGGTAMLILTQAFWYHKTLSRNLWLGIGLQNGFILLALLSRIEPVMLLFPLLMPFAVLLHGWQKSSWVNMGKAFAPALLLAVLTSIGLNIPFNQEDEAYAKIRPYQFTLWDFEQPNLTIDLADAKDSIIYLAARKSFLADPSQINEAFFQKINLNPQDKTPGQMLNYFKDPMGSLSKLGKFWKIFFARYPAMVVSGLLLMLLGFIVLSKKETSIQLRYVLAQLGFLGVLCGVMAFMKMEDRVFAPMFSWWLLSNIAFLATYSEESSIGQFRQYILELGLGMMLILAIIGLQGPNTKVKKRQLSHLYTQLTLEEIEEKAQGKIVMMDLWSIDRLLCKLPGNHSLPKGMTWLSIDNGIIFFHESYADYLEKITGARDFEGAVRFLAEHKENVLFVHPPQRMELFLAYANTVYGMNLSAHKIPEQFNATYLSLHGNPEVDRYFYQLD